VREVYAEMAEFSETAAPGAFLADLYPPLARIPQWMQWWRPRALRYYKHQETLWMMLWNQLKVQISLKQAPDCWAKQWAETDPTEKQGIDEVQAAFVAGCMSRCGPMLTTQC